MSDYTTPVFKHLKNPKPDGVSESVPTHKMFRVENTRMDEVRRKLRDELRPKLVEAVTSGVEGSYYCNKGWWAWNAGMMTKDDFVPAEESQELIDTLVDKIIGVLNLNYA